MQEENEKQTELLKEEESIKNELNLNQERFCQLYARDTEFFGNGVQTYIEVYEPPKNKQNWYAQACVSASEILSNPKVCKRINEILEETGFSDVHVDKQLSFLLTQHADLGTKLGAIKEYNKLKARILNKLDVMSDGKAIQGNTIIFKDFKGDEASS